MDTLTNTDKRIFAKNMRKYREQYFPNGEALVASQSLWAFHSEPYRAG